MIKAGWYLCDNLEHECSRCKKIKKIKITYHRPGYKIRYCEPCRNELLQQNQGVE